MFTNLTDMQMAGLITILVTTPMLLIPLRNLYLAKASKLWNKVNGTIVKMPGISKGDGLIFEYTVNGVSYSSRTICFTNTKSPMNEVIRKFEEKYSLNKIVDVYYNPEKHKQAVLEPGRRDGLLFAITFLSAILVVGIYGLFNQNILLQLIGSFL